MIEINLVPDVKRQAIQAERTRNLVISLSILIGLGSIALAAILGIIIAGQIGVDRYQQGQIDSEYKKLVAHDDLINLVTYQQQLKAIPDINAKRTMDSRLFDVLNAINPAAPNNVQFNSVVLDPDDKTLVLEGTARAYPSVEVLVKSIENADMVALKDNKEYRTKLVSKIVLGKTSLGKDGAGNRVTNFELTLTYAEGLFDNTTQKTKIELPSGTVDVTDSRAYVPESLFTTSPETIEGGN